MRLEDMRGQRYGRYEILELLGRGGMAAVYRARDTMLQRDVALKLLYPQYSGDTTLVERFEREAVLAAGLDHAGIVPIYDVGESAGVVYIAMKLLNGRSLGDVLAAAGMMQPAELVPIVEQIASALDYAHARGIVHRDIKPANIILEQRGRPGGPPEIAAVLTDFGIAKSLDSPSMTGTGVLIGTPDYMAPEQIRGERGIDGRADVYALGALVFRALTGRRPFEGSTQEVLLGHLEGRLPAPSAINPALPPAVDDVIQRAMALRPADRYDSAGAFARAMRAATGLESPTPPPAARLPGDPRAVIPAAVASDLARRASAYEQTVQATSAPTARGAVPNIHARPALDQRAQQRALPEAAPRRSRIPTVLLVGAGLLVLLGAGLLIGRLSAGGFGAVPTPAAATPQASTEPGPTSVAALPTSSPTPSDTAAPSATSAPPTPPTALPTTSAPATSAPASPTTQPTSRPPTVRPTSAPPTTLPATTIVPSATPSVTPPPSSTPTATTTPTATPSSTPTPTATPCAITTIGGFAMLREQNEVVRTRLGCPAQPIQGGAGTLAEQPFQHGSMLYFQPREAIWVFIGVEKGIWYRFDQATLAGTPTPTPAEPPEAGLYVPVRGFGLIWAYNEEIRTELGYGTAPEAGLFEGAYQPFAGGTMLYSATGLGRGKTLYVLYADGTFERYDDPNQ